MAYHRAFALIDAASCSGCGRCIAACHLPLIAFETTAWRKTAVIQDVARCTGCAKCAVRCPVGAISMVGAAGSATPVTLAQQTADLA